MDSRNHHVQSVAPRNELLAVACVMFVVPLVTSFAFPTHWTFIEPRNRAYHHMLLTVYWAFTASAMTITVFSPGVPWTSLLALLVFFLIVHTALWAVNSMWGQVVAWALVILSLVGIVTRQTSKELPNWLRSLHVGAFHHWHKRSGCPPRLKVLSAFFSFLPFGMLSGPTFAPWEPVQKYVRWHPYNERTELLWRGNFFTFAVFFWVTSSNPIRHASIILFFAWHGVLHSTVMLVDNLRDLDGNGNHEHAIEISFFFLLGIFSAFCVRATLPRLQGHTPVRTGVEV